MAGLRTPLRNLSVAPSNLWTSLTEINNVTIYGRTSEEITLMFQYLISYTLRVPYILPYTATVSPLYLTRAILEPICTAYRKRSTSASASEKTTTVRIPIPHNADDPAANLGRIPMRREWINLLNVSQSEGARPDPRDSVESCRAAALDRRNPETGQGRSTAATRRAVRTSRSAGSLQ